MKIKRIKSSVLQVCTSVLAHAGVAQGYHFITKERKHTKHYYIVRPNQIKGKSASALFEGQIPPLK